MGEAEPTTLTIQAIRMGDGETFHGADLVEQETRDFILKRLTTEIQGDRFIAFVEGLLSAMGNRTRLAPEGPDGVVDILAYKVGLESQTLKVHVKRSTDPSTDHEVAALAGKLVKNEIGMVVSLAGFTPAAKTFVSSRNNLRLIDGDKLVELAISNYEKLDAKLKAVIPLRKIYVPEALSGSN